MDSEFIKLMIEKYGTKGLVTALVIFGFSAFLRSKIVSDMWNKIGDIFIEWFLKVKTKPTEIRTIVESDILNHDVFNYIDFWMYSKVPTFQFSTDYRTVVFRKYLIIYLNCYKKGLSEFVKSNNYKTMDQSELWKNLLSTINQIVWDYEKECDQAGIPKIIVDKMKAKNNDTIQLTIDLIEGISNSQFYSGENNYLKIYSILNIILSVLENTLVHSESTCNSINGQLRGLSMDGKTEP